MNIKYIPFVFFTSLLFCEPVPIAKTQDTLQVRPIQAEPKKGTDWKKATTDVNKSADSLELVKQSLFKELLALTKRKKKTVVKVIPVFIPVKDTVAANIPVEFPNTAEDYLPKVGPGMPPKAEKKRSFFYNIFHHKK